MVRVMPISYQTRAQQSDAEAIGGLMAERLGADVAELVIDYMPVQTLNQGAEKLALVAMCKETAVLEFLERLRIAGLKVSSLEIGPIAIRRLVVAQQKNLPPQNTLVVNCGRVKSYLTVIADERLLADDEIEFGEQTLLDQVQETLGLELALARKLVTTTNLDPRVVVAGEEKAGAGRALTQIIKPYLQHLVHEIERGLVFANSESRGSRLNRVYLLGSFARWLGADKLLESMLDVPVAKIPNPVSLFGPQASEASPELAVATGLALKGCSEHA
jgi:Tfp pilus assembly PilM family ATPase